MQQVEVKRDGVKTHKITISINFKSIKIVTCTFCVLYTILDISPYISALFLPWHFNRLQYSICLTTTDEGLIPETHVLSELLI